jgi:hypothetical protein
MPQSTYGSGSERFGDAAKDQMKRVGEQAENVANRVAEQGRRPAKACSKSLAI